MLLGITRVPAEEEEEEEEEIQMKLFKASAGWWPEKRTEARETLTTIRTYEPCSELTPNILSCPVTVVFLLRCE